MSNRTHNPEKRAWRGRSYKKGGESTRELLDEAALKDLKPIAGEGRYVEWDEGTAAFCVFGDQSGFAYANFCDEGEANQWLKDNPGATAA